jgi:tetratricopeptide (TPR) repeat protein
MVIPMNPYVAGNPVGGSPAFIGRADVLREVLRVLRRSPDNAVVLYGQRRVGKTSILQHLAAWLSRRGPYRLVYFDLQDKAAWPLGRVLWELARKVAHALGQPDPDLGPDPEIGFRQEWLPAVLDNLPEGCSLVLLFDEFDVLTDPRAEQAAAAFFPYLRGLLASDPRRLQFVFVIGRNVDDLDNIALSLFKGTPYRRVSLLDREDTADLVRLSEANDTLRWPDEAVEQVWGLTHGHPFLTQQLCSHVWERAYDEEPGETLAVAPEDVDAAIPDALEVSRNTLEWLWDGLPPAERVVASALAEAGPGPITREALGRLLHESGVRVVIRELQNAPQLLQDWDLIEPADGGYRFRVELLRRWIAEHKPLHRVQEELDHIEPVAENLYQAALGLYQGGQLDQAVALLRQAIALNPNHVRANQLLADLLLAQGQASEARQLLLRLYEYQPTAALPRLVQVLLYQAHIAENDDKELASYERVLELDPKQPEATAGRQRIWQQRGDTALEADDLQAALEAYRKAGLTENVREVEEEMRRRYLAALQAEAQAHRQAEQWAEAAAVYEQLVAHAPDDKSRMASQVMLERCLEEKDLARLFDEGLEALRQGNWQRAQRALAEVVHRRPDYQRNGQLAAFLLLTQAVSREPVVVPWRQYRQLLPRAVVISVIVAFLMLLGGGWVANIYYFQPREAARQTQAAVQVAALVTAAQQTVAAQDANAAAVLANRDATASARNVALIGTATSDAAALAGTATADAMALAGTATAQAEALVCRDVGLYELAVAPEPTLYPPPGTVYVVGAPPLSVRATWVMTNTGECSWQGVELHPLTGGEAVAPVLRRGGQRVARVEPGEQVEMVLAFSAWAARDVDVEWVVAVNGLSLFDQPHLRLTVARWMIVVTPTPTPVDTATPTEPPELPAPTGTPELPAPTSTLEPSPVTTSTPLSTESPEPQPG